MVPFGLGKLPSMATLTFNSVTVLRGVKHAEVLKKLLQGTFPAIGGEMKEEHSRTDTVPLEKYQDPNNQVVLVAAVDTNADAVLRGEVTGIACDHCRRVDPPPRMGMPIDVLLLDGKETYVLEDYFNTWNCMLAAALERSRTNLDKYNRAIGLIRTLYKRIHPGKVLKPALDYRLLAPRGPLTPEQYYAQSQDFTEFTRRNTAQIVYSQRLYKKG